MYSIYKHIVIHYILTITEIKISPISIIKLNKKINLILTVLSQIKLKSVIEIYTPVHKAGARVHCGSYVCVMQHRRPQSHIANANMMILKNGLVHYSLRL